MLDAKDKLIRALMNGMERNTPQLADRLGMSVAEVTHSAQWLQRNEYVRGVQVIYVDQMAFASVNLWNTVLTERGERYARSLVQASEVRDLQHW